MRRLKLSDGLGSRYDRTHGRMNCNTSCALFWYSRSIPGDVSQCGEDGTVVATAREGDSLRLTFDYEAELVEAAIELMSAGLDDWGVADFALEFDHRCGRTDIIAL